MCLGEGAIQVWIQSIDQARFAIWVLVFSLDYPPVEEGLVQAVDRGFDLRVMIDVHQTSKAGNSRAMRELRRGGVAVKTVTPPNYRYNKKEELYGVTDEPLGPGVYAGQCHKR